MSADNNGPPRRPDQTVPPVVKGFIAGAIVSHLNKAMALGIMIGTTAGAYYQQEHGAVDVKTTFNRYYKMIKESIQSPK